MGLIYVDSPVYKKSPNGRKNYAHMVGSSLDGLRAFAEKIGVKPHFWHAHGRLSHFDITEEQHAVAIAEGAIQLSTKELVAKSYIMNQATKVAEGAKA